MSEAMQGRVATDTYQWPERFWAHQRRGCQAVVDRIAAGTRRIVFTAPCGCGKTACMSALVEYASSQWWRTVLYTHRRLLLGQTSGVLDRDGIRHGIRAAGLKPALAWPVQLAMIQTEAAAVLHRKRRELHDAQLVLTDELHAVGGETMPEFHRRHYEAGAAIAAFTATPIDLTGEWDELITACTTSEGRACGALVKAVTYCPDEPDMRHIRRYKVGEDLTDQENHKAIMRPGVFGRVHSNWERLNPKHKATILFAPDVAGSIFFAEEFTKAGISVAHIDAKEIWRNGVFIPSDDDNRAQLLRDFEAGQITVLCNRWILKEAIDLPFVAHAILACVIGSLKSYLQMTGRVIRYHPDTPTVCIQDHGGCYRRHGSVNEDRHWELGMSGCKITALRQEAMRERPEIEPILCPACGAARLSGPVCHACGHRCHKHSRRVVQIDGELNCVEGPAYKPHTTRLKTDTEDIWKQMYYRAKSKKWNATFQQAMALFAHENHYWPPKDLPFMPVAPSDFFEKVADVDKSNLRGKV